MATSTDKVNAKILVNAYGQPAGGVSPHFLLLVDGVDAGQASVSSTSPKAYEFSAPVTPSQAHKVQVFYDNDGLAGGQDRNLYVKSLVVNDHTLLPTEASYDRGQIDGIDVISGRENMWWYGALGFNTPASFYPGANPVPTPVPTPTPTASTITVNAHANLAGGVGAHFKLLVDGVKVGDAMTTATAKDYTFTTNAALDTAHKVQIQYDNDAIIGGVDRNLLVDKIIINNKSIAPTDSFVTYDKGALDGKNVIAGQSGLWENGTLVVNASKEFFSSMPVTPNPTPTPDPDPTPTPTPDPVPNPNPNPPSGQFGNQIFADEFNGTALDTSKWTAQYDGGGPSHDSGSIAGYRWDKSQLSVSDGKLHIGMEKQADGVWDVGGTATYPESSAPGFTFTYGKVEIMAKVDPGVVGAGPCFLLWPASRDHWPPEVDILETPHGHGQFTNHYQGPNGNGDNQYDYTEFPLDPTQSHRYGLEWTPDHMTMTVDDKVVKTLTDHIPTEPMSVALQGYVASSADTWYGGSPNASGVSLVGVDVDYVHVNQWVGG